MSQNQWRRPAHFDRNLIVLGAGAGGLVTAYIAAAVKAKVTLIETHQMGGDCLNNGCVPSKTLIHEAKRLYLLRQSGISIPETALATVAQHIQNTIQAIAPHDSMERYTSLGVEVLRGYGRLLDPWTVEIEHHTGKTQRLTARSLVIATGAKPIIPALPGLENIHFATSDTLWERLHRVGFPKRLVILGGGPMGCELAQSFARLGIAVTQVEQAPRLLSREAEIVSTLITERLRQEGVQVLTGCQAIRCERVDDVQFLIIKDAQGLEQRLELDLLLLAIGRVARLQGYGLAVIGLEDQGRHLPTNTYLQTCYPHIYAVGDVTGPYQFTHAAAHQAGYAAVNALFGLFKRTAVDYRYIPMATFTDPEIARVGLTEQEAQAQKIAYEITHYEIAELDRAITEGATTGFIRVLTPPGKDKILGVTLVGERAGELLAEWVLAMKYGLGLKALARTLHAYPTWAEANRQAAGQWVRAHTPAWALSMLAYYHQWRLG